MTDKMLDDFLIGLFLPWLVAVIVQTHWPARAKQLTAGAVYVVVTVFLWLFHNSFDTTGQGWRDVVRVFAPVVIGGVTGFVALWQHTVVPTIEHATNVNRPDGAA